MIANLNNSQPESLNTVPVTCIHDTSMITSGPWIPGPSSMICPAQAVTVTLGFKFKSTWAATVLVSWLIFPRLQAGLLSSTQAAGPGLRVSLRLVTVWKFTGNLKFLTGRLTWLAASESCQWSSARLPACQWVDSESLNFKLTQWNLNPRAAGGPPGWNLKPP